VTKPIGRYWGPSRTGGGTESSGFAAGLLSRVSEREPCRRPTTVPSTDLSPRPTPTVGARAFSTTSIEATASQGDLSSWGSASAERLPAISRSPGGRGGDQALTHAGSTTALARACARAVGLPALVTNVP
jgi:hypothetical protein